MKDQNKQFWTGVETLTNDPVLIELAQQEFSGNIAQTLSQEPAMNLNANRRDFLKYLGFGLGAATVAAGCEIPVRKAIPYVVKPDEIVPGVATYYASSFALGGDYCPVLVKTREGRPIKIEGNALSSLTQGGTSARAQAAVLSLYDTSRFNGPYRAADGKIDQPKRRGAKGPGWEAIDREIMAKLTPGSRVRIVANTLLSPTAKKAIEDFKAAFPNTDLVMYDPVSSSAILEANERCFGDPVVPAYSFDKAMVIVSFDADFLGTWISPIEYAAQYVKNRTIQDVKKVNMSHHVQVESHMSLTGSNADNRILVKPSEMGAAIVALYNELAAKTGATKVSGPSLPTEKVAKIKKVAAKLLQNSGQALVVSGSNNTGEQVLVNAINAMLDSYGNTIDLTNASLQRQGRDSQIQALISDMKKGNVDALFVWDGANPSWDLPNSKDFNEGLKKVKLKVSFSGVPNETALHCDYLAPTHHWLESWSDAEPKRDHYSLIQPTIAPLFDTRQAEISLLTWSSSPRLDKASDQPMYAYLQAHWQDVIFPKQSKFATFQAFWGSALHDGVVEFPLTPRPAFEFVADVAQAAATVRKPSNSELEISFYETVNMGAGQYANNPWLQEMPDPIARTVWGNYLAIPVGWDGGNKFQAFKNLNAREAYGHADLVEVTVNGVKQTVTAVRQFGQPQGTVALALGYGREVAGVSGKALGSAVGVNAFPWCFIDQYGNTQYYAAKLDISDRVAEEDWFACVQYHHSMGVTGTDPKTGETINVDEKTAMTLGAGYQGGIVNRSIIYQGKAAELPELVGHIKERRTEAEELNSKTLYPFDEYVENVYSQGHWWAMHVDLNACIGCGACQVACVAENNVPVVGKHEVARHHEMAWLRIDRYFYGDYENPNVVYQPMMCQHCDNAPCENVCPVAATPHSSEGLNQMTYNRCIGTRYCANNCPYKVRRFNWLDYTTADLFAVNENEVNGEDLPYMADNLVRMVLNPDVTVRSRGVIEKCSFCVQRIQEGKLTARREGRKLVETDVKTACQTACPTGAIVFGDRNDKSNTLSKRLENPLNYIVLEEINVRSSVNYQARVNNRDEALDA